jgi:sarcosine oxidase subunit delta
MRLNCPYCGSRDIREFSYRGAAELSRPGTGASADEWESFLHLRDNPAGPTRELWHHGGGCSAWVVVERNTQTHEVMNSWDPRAMNRGEE